MHDFNNILVHTCTVGGPRIHDAFAAISAVMVNVHGAKFCLSINRSREACIDGEPERCELLTALAIATGNTFSADYYSQNYSKAFMVYNTIGAQSNMFATVGDDCWFLNLDDDWIVPDYTLGLLNQARQSGKANTYIYGMFDIINYRDHADWSDQVVKVSDILDFVEKNGARCLHNHLMEVPDELLTYKLPKHSTGTHLIKLGKLVELYRDYKLEVFANWPKGKRGYDVVMCDLVHPVHQIFGANSFHTDRTKKHIDGQLWNQAAQRDDMRLDGTQTFKEA